MKNGIFSRMKVSTLVKLIAAVIFVILIPILNEGYSMMVINLALIYSIASLGLSIMLGMGGQLTFATVAFMGIGAYITANLCSGRQGFLFPTSWTILVVVVASLIISFIIGMILFRLKGTFFTFATIGLVQVCWSFFLNYKPLFGGPDGISDIKTITIFNFTPKNYNQWFYLLCVFVLIAALLVERIRKTQLGRSLGAVRDNEIAAQTLGINVYMTKVIAFAIAGMLAAVAGSLYAMHSQFVSSDMFNWERATSYILMVMLGGVNNTTGVLIGSALVTMLPEWLRGFQRYLQLIYGVGIILLMVFMPMGLAGLANELIRTVKRKLKWKTSDYIGPAPAAEAEDHVPEEVK